MIRLPRTTWKYSVPAYLLVVVGWLVYAGITFMAPVAATNARFHLSHLTLVAIQLTVVLPVIIIWLIAVNGAVMLKSYATLIDGGLESQAISYTATGLLWTIAYLVISSIMGAIATLYMSQSHIHDVIVVIRDHLNPLASLIAFAYIYRGSHLLRDVSRFSTWTRNTAWILAGYAIFAFLFVLKFSTSPAPTVAGASRTTAAIVPPGILLFTLIVPFLLAWFLGVLSTVNFTKYANTVKGVIYRKALRDLILGIWGVIVFGVILQLLTFATKYFANLQLAPILAIVYLLLILYCVGFLFIRSGAKKLARLEATH